MAISLRRRQVEDRVAVRAAGAAARSSRRQYALTGRFTKNRKNNSNRFEVCFIVEPCMSAAGAAGMVNANACCVYKPTKCAAVWGRRPVQTPEHPNGIRSARRRRLLNVKELVTPTRQSVARTKSNRLCKVDHTKRPGSACMRTKQVCTARCPKGGPEQPQPSMVWQNARQRARRGA